jgi:beta-mannosidase
MSYSELPQLRPKPAYFAIKRELDVVTVGIQRTVRKNRENDRPRQFYECKQQEISLVRHIQFYNRRKSDGAFQNTDATMDVWATNSSSFAIKCSLEMAAYDLESEWSWSYSPPDVFILQPNASTELCTAMPVPAPDTTTAAGPFVLSGSVVIQARLHAVGLTSDSNSIAKPVMARASDWPQPYKFIDFAALAVDTTVSAVITDLGEQSQVSLSTTRPVKCLSLGLESWEEGEDEVVFSDNAVSRRRASAIFSRIISAWKMILHWINADNRSH